MICSLRIVSASIDTCAPLIDVVHDVDTRRFFATQHDVQASDSTQQSFYGFTAERSETD